MTSFLNEIFGSNVWVINLKEDQERLDNFHKEAAKIGLSYKRFQAIGRDEMIELGYIGPNLDTDILPAKTFVGKLGCGLSHLNVVRKILDSKQPGLIFEDDASFPKDFDATLRKQWRTLPGDWNIVRLGCGVDKGSRLRINEDWTQIGTGWWGQWCYGIRDSRTAVALADAISGAQGQHSDIYLRTLGFGEIGSGINVYRPNPNLVKGGHTGTTRTRIKP
jgi:hypothetical protein